MNDTIKDILLFFASIAILALCGCQTPRSSYTNGVILWMGSTALGVGYGEYIEVAPGGKVHRKITGQKDKLELIIDNSAVKVKEEVKNHDEN